MYFHHLFEIETDIFKGVAPRPDAINELIGGDEFAVWLRERLILQQISCKDIYAEDHGWDFVLNVVGRSYLIVCSCEFEDEELSTEWHSVQIAQIKGEIIEADPILDLLRKLLIDASELTVLADESISRR
ncbi:MULTISPECIES: hypothetical protein [Acinetobacter]|uniref:hypothetical protein n=1 Tax=Acinetobacter TaxID=469 RepID=UPI00051AFA83|nr:MULTISPECIES: hypothetical protein [Acinetobacter]MCH7304036.1 hypothetical protein [Acinetobacter higginsii]MCH7378664.1 hypothetical protein [Acinetobacter higginsii]MCJ0827006.1 hypothetical protein [Acinetobacter sp. NIPH1876]